ncbi:helix-turn-helix domain-containing protein [Nonomuraea zeae]|uniref:Helix-turn-helix domain-containing protein n=1 Tax=Nonomuraea zeae TaxID=1642303 RepID=A0A5S4H3K5_9ACTN|nr:helix-turn-helix domain-containing protein [Nonomuraea zeae]TMR39589.1 helix-turn-helix domain-containing protein [Nonomuraea zeae]
MQDQALAPVILRIFAQALAASGFTVTETNTDQQVSSEGDDPKFYSVAKAASLFGISPMGLYRAIHSGRFPAVRVGARRYFIPAAAIHEMAEAATLKGLVDAADWVAGPNPIVADPLSSNAEVVA